MKSSIKALFARTPYQVIRRGRANRFAAIEEALESLKRRGFAPRQVIDAGANVGAFTSFTLNLFPMAKVHAIEPQPGCKKALDLLGEPANERLLVHSFALGAPDQDGTTIDLAADATSTSTGAHITIEKGGEAVIRCPCVTLDRLMTGILAPDDGALLKLDLQGYELQALRGAVITLASCDVVLTEVSFYAQGYEPPISELIGFLAQEGFELHDIAAIYARPRDDRPRQGDFIFVRKGCYLAVDTAWA